MKRFDKDDKVIIVEEPWYYTYSESDETELSNLKIGDVFTVDFEDDDGDIFFQENNPYDSSARSVVNESCLRFEEDDVIDTEFEENDSKYCTCGGPSKFHQYTTFSYSSCISCRLEKR